MGRSYSYSPSPPRDYGRGRRSPSLMGSYRGRSRDAPTSLLVRNLRHDCRPDDLRRPFGRFGRLKDIYLPRDYYSGEPRGFGFVQYYDPADAADAKYHLDGYVLLGREITVVFAEENRKKPYEMRARERQRSRGCTRSPLGYFQSPRYRRSYSRSPHDRRSYSRSPYRRSYSRSLPRYERGYSRSVSPAERRQSYSRSPYGSRSRSQSPIRGRSLSPGYSR
ncbi:PREDICTED: serine/arginine-rich SC35-like splicing factor SCL33 [Tarenaya hassleriana]|uniref:serine/arginine-rich SC35-like splicing factor SCL33 n=1 Tax=Tarenaya hassleriana TaxID=28532 RepID=UPI00053C9882|nr:PREDICTED: serine/arginine-rich SC35-like splicing factor SCL33 [Tarenaya hassleriana]